MSEKDKLLIDKANKIICFEWGKIDILIEQAESLEAKEILRGIQNRLYHLEEYSCGVL